MASDSETEDAAVDPLCFVWTINNPFLVGESMTATFYNGCRTLTRWIVKLVRLPNGEHVWTFQFSLNCVQPGEDYIIVAETIKVYMKEDKNLRGLRGNESGYSFSPANQHTFQFPTPISADAKLLQIRIEICLQDAANREGNALDREIEDLRKLSVDMVKFASRPIFFNMSLKAPDRDRIFRVHSYILRTRWNNFFEMHPSREDVLELDISGNVLATVLTYVYSSFLDVNGVAFESDAFRIELFQVIDRYEMHHFYQSFRMPGSPQARRTVSNVVEMQKSFPLSDRRGRKIENRVYSWPEIALTDTDRVLFHFEFFLDQEEPRFSYRLDRWARHQTIFFVKVKVEYRVLRGKSSKLTPVAVHHYKLHRNDMVSSDMCPLEGLGADFDKLVAGRVGRRRSQHFMKFTLYFSDGTTIMYINEEEETVFDLSQSSLEVLSDHMYELLVLRTEWDLNVVCPAENPEDPDENHFVHRGIFAMRVPKWRAAFESYPHANSSTRCVLFGEAFRHVADFMYTGKTLPFPIKGYKEIRRFARECEFEALLNNLEVKNYGLLIDQLHPRLFPQS